ncbi:MAG: gamma-glutamyltransferase [Bacilli bacterium]|nr:gamma-glutamyltransferase [Bacilli bacterium]
MKKQLIMFIMALFLVFAMTACGGDPTPDPVDPPIDPSGDETGFFKYIKEDDLLDLSSRTARGTHGVVAAANPYASYAGYYTLQNGGNAFDAAVAVAFALGVVEPYASGVGGGGVMTAYNAKTGEYLFYNFREFAPAKAIPANYDGTDLSLKEGIGAAAVPTEVLGLCKIIDDLGNLDYEKVLEPAIYYAENGFTVTDTLASNIYDSVLQVPGMINIFGNGRRALRAGEKLVQTDYAKVLKEIANKGAEGFYTGWVREAILKAYADRGGLVTGADLDYAVQNYPIIDTPLTGSYNGYDIVSANTPSSGGIILIETLNMLEYYSKTTGTKLSDLGHNSAEYLHLISTAMHLSYADKRHYIADRKIENVPIEGLSDKAYAAQRFNALYDPTNSIRLTSSYDWGGADREARGYNNDKSPFEYQSALDEQSYKIDLWEDDNGTTTFSVADSEGNIVSFTQTINHFWGAFVVPDGCGFFLNNQMSSFSTTTTSVHYLKPYKQPVSHIMPTIILKDGDPIATLGSPGSTRIPSAVINVVLNLLDFGMDIQSAINSPRVYSYAVAMADVDLMKEGQTVNSHKLLELENVGLADGVLSALEAKNYSVNTYDKIDLYFGGVQGITFNYDENGKLLYLEGGADPRRDGKALGY